MSATHRQGWIVVSIIAVVAALISVFGFSLGNKGYSDPLRPKLGPEWRELAPQSRLSGVDDGVRLAIVCYTFERSRSVVGLPFVTTMTTKYTCGKTRSDVYPVAIAVNALISMATAFLAGFIIMKRQERN